MNVLVSRRIHAAIAAAMMSLAACSDNTPVGPSSSTEIGAPTEVPGGFPEIASGRVALAQLNCKVELKKGRQSCSRVQTNAAVPLDLRYNDTQANLTVNVGASGAGNPGQVIAIPGSVTNLMAQPFGTTDGITVTGLKVWFTNVQVTSGIGDVTLQQDGFCDCSGTNGGALVEGYIGYNEIVQPYATSTTKNWNWMVSLGNVDDFIFTVWVIGNVPEENAALRWLKDGSQGQPQGPGPDNLYGVHGRTNSEVYAVGDTGRIFRFDGTTWTQQNGLGAPAPQTPVIAQLRSIFGWGTTGTADRATYAAGFRGTMLMARANANGGQWTDITTLVRNHDDSLTVPLRTTWYGIWCGGAGNCVFVGAWGQIRRWNGERFPLATDRFKTVDQGTITSRHNPLTLGSATSLSKHLVGVYGFGASNVYAVGQGGLILHWDGSAWKPMTTNTSETLYNVWGTSATNVYAAGTNGTLLHFDGNFGTPANPVPNPTWTRVTVPPGYSNFYFWGLWGTGPNDVYLSGQTGDILHFNGTKWFVHKTNQTNRLYSLWGTTTTALFGVGINRTIIRGTN